MKKLMFIGLVLTLFSVAASAQQASDENYRHHSTEQGYRKGEGDRQDVRGMHRDHQRMRMERRRDFREGRMNRFERHRIHRMHRHERRHYRRHHHRI
jgi:hypothetical protein